MAYMTPQRLSFLLEGLLCKEEKEKEPTIRVFTDASFSPEGEESHGCFVVMLNDCLLSWRSGRQSTITLCIVEAVAVIISELWRGGSQRSMDRQPISGCDFGERRRELANQTLEHEVWLRPITSDARRMESWPRSRPRNGSRFGHKISHVHSLGLSQGEAWDENKAIKERGRSRRENRKEKRREGHLHQSVMEKAVMGGESDSDCSINSSGKGTR